MLVFENLDDSQTGSAVFRFYYDNTRSCKNMSNDSHVNIKPATRNHKGFFIQPASYKLMSIDKSGWALICMDKAVCHYVDPDDLQLPNKSGMSEG